MLKEKHPIYSSPSIAKVSSLASILSISENELINIASSVDSFYKPGKLLTKKTGEPRKTHDARKPLKQIHELIKTRILKQVSYPKYMLGGIADPINPRGCKAHAEIHCGKKILISEDIKNFYPNSNRKLVHGIWQYCFNFSPEVAEIITELTTYNDELPQGWKTSGYLANLVFWDKEPNLVATLEQEGYVYSRFMDDITVSSKHKIGDKQKSYIIKNIYGMLNSKGYQPKRSKHEVMTQSGAMSVTGLSVNAKKPKLSKKIRHEIRSMVFKLEKRYQQEKNSAAYCADWRSVSGHVNRVKSLHKVQGDELRKRINVIKPSKKLLNMKKWQIKKMIDSEIS